MFFGGEEAARSDTLQSDHFPPFFLSPSITPPPHLTDLPTSSDRLNSLLFSSPSVYLPQPLPPSRSYYL